MRMLMLILVTYVLSKRRTSMTTLNVYFFFFFLSSRFIPQTVERSRLKGPNFPSSFFAKFWRLSLMSGGTQRCRATLCFDIRAKNTDILNILFPRMKIEPTTCRVYRHTLCLCAITGFFWFLSY